MSGKSLIDQIKHYQKDIERCPDNSERMIRCIQKLYTLPIKVGHLQETGVGKSVNSLRKYKGEVGDAAKALVAKWKAMVAAEESSDESNEPSSDQPQLNEMPPSPPTRINNTDQIEKKVNHESNRDRSSYKNKNGDSKHHSSNKSSHISGEKLHYSSSKNSDQLHTTYSNDRIRDKVSSSTIKNKSSGNECLDKSSDIKCNVKSSDYKHSSSSRKRSHSHSKDHPSDKKNSSHKTHKDSNDRRDKTNVVETPPPHKKHKKHSRNHSSSSRKEIKSETEEESSNSDESERVLSDHNQSGQSDEESNDSNKSDSEAESNSSSSSDHRHRSNHKSSHHKHSSHSKEKNIDAKAKYKDHKSKHKDSDKSKHKESEKSKYKESDKSKHKESDKTKEKRHESKKHEKYSVNLNLSPDYKDLIEENERKIKREKEEIPCPKYVPTAISKPIKKERNEDDSIDCVSGASFGDALLGMDNYSEQKKKKKSSNSCSRKSSSVTSSSYTDKYKTSSALKPSSSNSKSIDELVEAPELLSKKIKLEALDLDISLPEINPNYKPLPHIPERKASKPVFDENTMFSHMAAKNPRTKVFSGNKVYQNTVPSLYNLCIQVLFDNVEAIEYTGGVPFNLLKPLLEKVNADQLYVLEHFNPYLIEETDELWKFHSNKDFRSEKRQDMESWRDLYLRCLEERERKLKALTANICQSMAKSTPVRQAKLAYVDSVVKPPRNIARKQAKYGTGDSTSSTKNLSKHEIVSKALVGGNTPGVSAKDVVPTPSPVARAAMHHPTPAIMKKKKAPLMQKALQVMKGTRYKR